MTIWTTCGLKQGYRTDGLVQQKTAQYSKGDPEANAEDRDGEWNDDILDMLPYSRHHSDHCGRERIETERA